MTPALVWQIYSLEVRRCLTYRLDFWVQQVLHMVIMFFVYWLLWNSIFSARGTTEIAGIPQVTMVFHYLLLPFVDRIVRGSYEPVVASDIYQGTLTRYLIYPVDFFTYKALVQWAFSSLAVIQLVVVFVVYHVFVFHTSMTNFPFMQLMYALLILSIAFYVYYLFSSTVQLAAFWIDQVWGLNVMIMMFNLFLGGGMIPLELFPDLLKQIVRILPFYSMMGWPIEVFRNQIIWSAQWHPLIVTVVWIVILKSVRAIIWRRGLRHFTGVGQ